MKITYDPRYNIAYIYLCEQTTSVETIEVSDRMNVDLAPDGTIYGIELLDANQQLGSDPEGKLVVINEQSNEAIEIPLSVRQ